MSRPEVAAALSQDRILDIWEESSHRSRNGSLLFSDGKDWTGFGETVPFKNSNAHCLEKFVHIRRKCTTTGYAGDKPAS